MKSIRIREAKPDDAGAIAGVHVASWRTTYPGIVPDAYLAGIDVREREGRWRSILDSASQTFTLVAETEVGELVGFAGGGRERSGDKVYRGELQALYLLESYQRRGIGQQLFEAVTARLDEAGMVSMMVWVASENAPARRFYEKLGVELVCDQDIAIGGESLSEVAYGWRDVS